MTTDALTIALITDVFHETDAAERLERRLREARARGADLALLPELPLDPWVPATKVARDEDAEAPGGPRHRRLAEAARAARIGVVGGAIVRDPTTGLRHNTALVVDAGGTLVSSYRKLHLPQEDGYWETSHYVPGDALAEVVTTFDVPIAVQVCSDVYRPACANVLAALGAEALMAPRCTPAETWERWRFVLRADAVVSTAYVISVNRPRPEGGAPIGGPSVAIAPSGEVLLETTDPVAVVTLQRDVVRRARQTYPGYVAVRADLYARAWAQVALRTR